MRRTIEGTLRVYRQRKGHRNWMTDMLLLAAEKRGVKATQYWPTRFSIQTSEPSRHAHINDGCKIYQFKRAPKWLTHEMAGATIAISATVEEWEHNGLGGYILRPTLLSISEVEA